MRKRAVIPIMLAAALALPGTAAAAGAQDRPVGTVLSVDRLIGVEVRGPGQERTGEIRELLIDMESGRIGFAVIAAGGILGLGDTTHFIPWKALSPGPDGTFYLSADREKMAEEPKRNAEMTDAEYHREVQRFYGVAPFSDGGDADPVGKTRPSADRRK